MKIYLDDVELKQLIQAEIANKIDTIIDEHIQIKVQDALFGRIDRIFSDTDQIRRMTDIRVKEAVHEQMPNIDSALLTRVGEQISADIAYALKENILESISHRLFPEEDINEDD